MHGLSNKQKEFVNQYLIDFNAKQACLRAGYSEKGAQTQGSVLLANPKVNAAIRLKTKEKEGFFDVKKNDVINELAIIAFSDLRDVASWGSGRFDLKDSDTLHRRQSSSVKKVTFKQVDGEKSSSVTMGIELHDKMKALELIGKHLGLFDIIDTDDLEQVVRIAFDPKILAKKKVKNDD
jgi:phage terminase small subunit